MPDTAEPIKEPRRERHLFRWVFLTLLVLSMGGVFAVFKWGDEDNLPGFAKVWKQRGKVLFNQIKYGRDKSETHYARWRLADFLFEQGSYRSAENQFRAYLASYELVYGTNSILSFHFHLRIAECLFMEGKKAEAAPLMRRGMEGALASPGVNERLFGDWFHGFQRLPQGPQSEQEPLSLNQFTMEQLRVVLKDDPARLRRLEYWFRPYLGVRTNAASAVDPPP